MLNNIGKKRSRDIKTFYGIPCQPQKNNPNAVRMPKAPIGDFSELGRELSAKMGPMQFCFKKLVGIYALRCGGAVMYIGKTTHLLNRIAVHICEKPPFDNVYFLEVPQSDISQLGKFEIALIQHFRPAWNVTYL